jgi:CO/xanthine dehydrogenase FAD-binding subunit
MTEIGYAAPDTLDGALELLAAAVRDGRPLSVLAGGTDLIVQRRARRRANGDAGAGVLDVKRIEALTKVREIDGGLEIGAAADAITVKRHPVVRASYPGLAEAIDLIGSTQIQGRATAGGNLCTASPAGDTIPAMIANGVSCRIRGSGGERTVPVEAFVTGVQRNALEPGELLVALHLPAPEPGSADAYLRFTPRTEMDIAVAGAGVRVTVDDGGVCTAARVGIGAVAPTALLVPAAAEALVGSRLDEGALAAAAAAASAAADPITDKRGTADFRRHVVGVLVRRAAAIARDRATTETA